MSLFVAAIGIENAACESKSTDRVNPGRKSSRVQPGLHDLLFLPWITSSPNAPE